MKTQTKPTTDKGKGPKFKLNVEGELVNWGKDTITTEEVIELGGWKSDLGAILIDLKTNEERTLKPGEEIVVKPGMGFSKKIKFKRG